MKHFLFACSALGLLIFGDSLANAEVESSAPHPVIVASFTGYAELKRDMDYFGELSGNPELAAGLAQLLLPFAQNQPLAGLNQEQRWGATLAVAGDALQLSAVAFLPADDFSKVLDALASHGEIQDAGNDIFEATHDAGTFFIRQKNKWAYVARRQSDLKELPVEPLEQFHGFDSQYDVALRVNLNNVPRGVRDLAALLIKQSLAGNARPRQREEQSELDEKPTPGTIEEWFNSWEQLESIAIGLNIDRSQGRTNLDLKVEALPGSDAARRFAAGFEPREASRVAGAFSPDSVLSLHLNSPLARGAEEQLATSLSALSGVFSAGIDAIEEITDERRAKFKELVATFLDAVADGIAKKGRINAGLVVTGPGSAGEFTDFLNEVLAGTLSKKYVSETIIGPGQVTVVVGGLVADGKALEDGAKQLVAAFGANSETKLNVDEYQGCRFHALSVYITPPRLRQVHASANVERFKKVFGNPLKIVLAFGEDACYAAVGEKGIATIKRVIDKSSQAPAKKLPLVMASLALAPALRFVASETCNATVARIADSLRQTGNDRLQLTVEPVAEGVLCRIEGQEAVNKLLAFSLGRAAGLNVRFGPQAAPRRIPLQPGGRGPAATRRDGPATTTVTEPETSGGRGRSMRRRVTTSRRSSPGRQISGREGGQPPTPHPDSADGDKSESAKPETAIRTWRSKNGKFSVQGRFMELQGETVSLETDAGDAVTVAIDKLSEPDQKLVRQLAEERKENPFVSEGDHD